MHMNLLRTLTQAAWRLRSWMMSKKKKLTAEQRKFLRTKLGPMLAKLGVAFAFELVPKIRSSVESFPKGVPKPELAPPTLPLFVELFFPLHAITQTIRKAVVEHSDPELVFVETTKSALGIVQIILVNETEAQVEAMYRVVDAEVKRIFAEVGFWDVLDEAEEVLG
jgi:hypothetical protein